MKPYSHILSALTTLTSLFFLQVPFSPPARARVHDYETTRLKSTAGAGVASVLMDESAILNPAPVAFFDVTSFYIHKMGAEFTPEGGSANPDLGSRWSRESDTYGFIVADGKNSLKGALGYQTQTEGFDHRKRLSASFASPVGQMSSFGVIYRWTKDSYSADDQPVLKDDYHQIVLGVTHAVNANLTLGATITDPMRNKREDSVAVVGTQVLFQDIISIMLDIGANYLEDPSQTFAYKTALQLNFFEDLYLRGGAFRDKGKYEKGTGMGLGWISPRLVLDFAIKNSRPLNPPPPASPDGTTTTDESNQRNRFAMREISFSMSYRF